MSNLKCVKPLLTKIDIKLNENGTTDSCDMLIPWFSAALTSHLRRQPLCSGSCCLPSDAFSS